MWKTKRQTKTHKKKQKPKKILKTFFFGAGFLSLFFVFFSMYSFLQTSPLIVPVPKEKGVKGITAVMMDSQIGTVERMLREKNIAYLFVTTASDSTYVVTLSENAEVLLKKDDMESQIASLQLIRLRLTMEGKRFSRLDLRFDRPVIVLK